MVMAARSYLMVHEGHGHCSDCLWWKLQADHSYLGKIGYGSCTVWYDGSAEFGPTSTDHAAGLGIETGPEFYCKNWKRGCLAVINLNGVEMRLRAWTLGSTMPPLKAGLYSAELVIEHDTRYCKHVEVSGIRENGEPFAVRGHMTLFDWRGDVLALVIEPEEAP